MFITFGRGVEAFKQNMFGRGSSCLNIKIRLAEESRHLNIKIGEQGVKKCIWQEVKVFKQ